MSSLNFSFLLFILADSDEESLNFDSSPDSSFASASSAETAPSATSSSSSSSSSSSDSANARRSRGGRRIPMSPTGSGSSRSSSAASAERHDTDHNDSSATEDYEVPEVIDLSATQFMTQAPVGVADEDDDDVMLIPQHIETIDLCSESIYENVFPAIPQRVTDEVIEIQDSPAAARGPRAMIPNRSAIRPAARQSNRTSPYQASAAAHKSPPKRRNLDLDDSNEEPTQRVKITCPICLDSSMKKKMVSTKCGHIHCEDCLKLALQNNKTCPVCRKALKGKDVYHPIFFSGHM